MKFFLRPYKTLGVAVVLGLGAGMIALPMAHAQISQIKQLLRDMNPLLSHSSSQGYLGVLVADVDNESATKLKLKEAHGAVITLIDHDAPAGQVGLRVNDVVLSLNGQNVEGAEQFGRMLREIPAGKKVTLAVSRDGAQQTMVVQLVDRKAMEQAVWNKMNSAEGFSAPPSGMALLPAGGGDSAMPGFHMPFFGSSLNVGALVEPLTSQMADYLGVPSGVMVKQVARKSEAANAGLKAFDVILKIGAEPIKTTADWDRGLRANEGKSVQVTILRDRKQQTLNLQVDSKRHSEVEYKDLFAPGECPQMAELQEQFGPEFLAQAEELREQAEAMRSQFSQQQMDELRKQAEKMAEDFKAQGFPEVKIDPKQMEGLRNEMEQFRKDFHPEDFKFDSQQMKELGRQMQEFQKSFPQQFQQQFDMNQQDSGLVGRPA